MCLKINNKEILENMCYINLVEYYHHYTQTHGESELLKGSQCNVEST